MKYDNYNIALIILDLVTGILKTYFSIFTRPLDRYWTGLKYINYGRVDNGRVEYWTGKLYEKNKLSNSYKNYYTIYIYK